MTNLILASSSRYRVELFTRLNLPFEHHSPDIDESPHPHEAPSALAVRLAETKARALRERFPQHLIVGSDQVAVCGDQILGKPGDRDSALRQLRLQSGKTTVFHTAVALYNSLENSLESTEVTTRVAFRELTDDEIRRYLDLEQPYYCAGSFKSESLGICLFKSAESPDPTALIGLPLIATSELIRHAGITII